MTPAQPLQAPDPSPLQELRALRQIARLPRFWTRLGHLPKGNAVVMVIPGFLTGDGVTWPLRRTLGALGHPVYGWGMGRNHGDVPALVPRVTAQVQRLADRHGPIHLIGWSLGGYLAREAARDTPQSVAQVITLASPIIGGPKYTAAAQYFVQEMGEDLDAIERAVAERDEVPLTTPITAIYSPIDKVVCPGACIDHVNPHTAHIAIACSHAGFGFNPDVFSIIARRLASHTHSAPKNTSPHHP